MPKNSPQPVNVRAGMSKKCNLKKSVSFLNTIKRCVRYAGRSKQTLKYNNNRFFTLDMLSDTIFSIIIYFVRKVSCVTSQKYV